MRSMKRITAVIMTLFTGFVLAVVIGGYVIKPKTAKPVASGTPSPTPPTTSSSTGSNTSQSNSNSSMYKDGEYLGQVANNIYGPVQVKVTISSGKITLVTFVQMPSASPVSVKIATNTGPVLQQETITAQSANIAIVSRATYDSNAYIQSLQSALNQAKAS